MPVIALLTDFGTCDHYVACMKGVILQINPKVTLVDVNESRAPCARALGADFALPADAPRDCDFVFHASATAAGLATALGAAGTEASVVELSWYGAGEVAAPLGEAFHSRRLRLIASQVGAVSASRRARWTHARRLAAALALLDDAALDVLLAPAVAFGDLPEVLPRILAAEGDSRCPLIRYPAAEPT